MANANYNIKVSASPDVASFNSIKQNLQSIGTMLTDLVVNQPKDLFGQSQSSAKELRNEIEKMQNALEKAYNNSLGSINLTSFNNEIQQSQLDLKKFFDAMQQGGALGVNTFRQISAELLSVNRNLEHTETFIDKMAETMGNTIKWGISSSIMNSFSGAVQQAYGYVKKLDGSLNDIRIVAGKSADEMERFAKQANDAAQNLGATTLDYTNASLIYYQQGDTDEEVAAKTNTTLKMANVLGTDASQVSDYMTAIWNNFDDGSKSLEYYADVLTELGAATASSAEEISTGLEKFAAVSDTVGLSYEYATAALTTVTATTRQSAEVVGTAFKTLFARIQDLELGETLEDGTTLGKYSEALEKVGINIMDSNGELKNMDNILDEMGSKWDTLSKAQQVSLAQTVAGTRQYTQLVALMDNWDGFAQNLEIAYNATGSLNKQQEIYMDSVEAHLNKMETSFEGLYSSILDEDTIKDFANIMTVVAKSLDHFVSGLGGGLTTLSFLGATATRVFSNNIAQGLSGVIQNYQKVHYNTKLLHDELELLEKYKDSGIIDLDKTVQEIVSWKSEIAKAGKVVTDEQQNMLDAIIDSKVQLQAQKDLILENAKAAEKFYHEMNPDMKDASDSVIQDQINAFIPDKEVFDKAFKEFHYATEGYYDGTKSTLFSVNDLIEDEGLETVKGTFNNIIGDFIELQDIIDGMSFFPPKELENIERLSSEITKLAQPLSEFTQQEDISFVPIDQIEDYIEILDALPKKIAMYRNAIEDGAEAGQKFIDSGEVQQYAKAMETKLGGALTSIDNKIETVNNDFKKLKKTVDLTSQIDNVVKMSGQFGQLASSIQSVANIGDIIGDDSLSSAEKVLQIIIALSTVIPSAIDGIKGFSTAFDFVSNLPAAFEKLYDSVIKLAIQRGAETTSIIKEAAAESLLAQSKEATALATAHEDAAAQKALATKGAQALVNNGAIVSEGALSAAQTATAVTAQAAEAGAHGAINARNIQTTTAVSAATAEGALAVAQTGAAVSANAATVSTVSLTTAIYTLLWPIGLVMAAIAAIIGLIYLFVEAATADAQAVKGAAEQVTLLADAYDKCKQKAEEFKKSISNYDGAIAALEELTKGTLEYEEALEKANEQAKALIEKYNLYSKYTIDPETGAIIIDKDALKDIENQQTAALDTLNRANFYANDNYDYLANRKKLKEENSTGRWTDDVYADFIEDVAYLTSKMTAEQEMLFWENSEIFKTTIMEWSDENGKIYSDLENSLYSIGIDAKDLVEVTKELIEARKTEAKLYYRDYVKSLKTIDSGSTSADELIASISANRLQEYEESHPEYQDQKEQISQDVADVSSNNDLNNFLEDYGLSEDVGKIEDDESLARIYARQILGMSEEEVRNLVYEDGNGVGTLKTSSGETVFEKNNDETMRRTIALTLANDQLLEKISSKVNVEDFSASLSKNYKKFQDFGAEYGADFGDAFLSTLLNNEGGKIDFSSITDQLSPEEVEKLKGMSSKEITEQLGIDPYFFTSYGYASSEAFVEAWQQGLADYNATDYYQKLLENSQSNLSAATGFVQKLQSGESFTDDEIKELEKLEEEYAVLGEMQETYGRQSIEYLETLIAVQNKISENAIVAAKALNQEEVLEAKNAIEELRTATAEELEQAGGEWTERDEEIWQKIDKGESDSLSKEDIQYYNRFQDPDVYTGQVSDVLDPENFRNKVGLMQEDLNGLKDSLIGLVDNQYEINLTITEDVTNKFNNVSNVLDQMKGAVSYIGDDFKVAAENVAELGMAFPGILKDAVILQDGTMQLNREVVKESMALAQQDAQKTIDNTVLKMEAYVADLKAKQAAAQAIADVAGSMVGQEEMNAKQLATIDDALTTLQTGNAETEATYEQDLQKDVADASQTNSSAMANNFAEAYQKMADDSKAWANQSKKNMLVATTGIGKAGTTRLNTHWSSSNTGTTIGEAELGDIKSAEDLKESGQSWEAIQEYYQDVANQYGLSANAAQSYIAELRAKGQALNDLSTGAAKGGKKDGGNKNEIEGELDRYHDVNIELAQIENNLQSVQKETEKLAGQKYIDNLRKQYQLLNKEIDTTDKKILIALEEQKELKQYLSSLGATFNADGTLANYTKIYTQQLKKAQASNSEEAQKAFDTFTENFERYDELITSFIPDLLESKQDALDKQTELKLDAFHYEIDLRIDMGELTRDWNEFKNQVLNDLNDEDILGNALWKFEDVLSYFKDGASGVIQENTQHINEIIAQLQQMKELGNATLYDQNEAILLEDLEKYYNQLKKDLTDIHELSQEIQDSYVEMLDQAQEKFDEQISTFETINDLLEHDKNVISMIYGKESYSTLAQFYDRQEENYNKQLDFQKQQVEFWKMQMETAEEGSDAWEAAKENWLSAVNEWNAAIETAIQNLQDKYLNAINAIFQELNNDVTGGLGLDYIESEWDLINRNADEYLDSVNAIYNVQQLQSKYLEAIENTDSPAQQKKLNDLMAKEMEYLREQDKLSQYDLDRANLKYEIALKEMALEEAKQNKTQLRLRRDSQGNYTYQYTADDDQVSSIQQEVADLYNQLYNLDAEEYRGNLESLYDVWSEFQEKMAEAAQINDPEQRAAKELLIKEQYGELINTLTEKNELAQANLYNSTMSHLFDLYNQNIDNYDMMSAQQQEILNQFITAETDLSNAAFDNLFGLYNSNIESFYGMTEAQQDILMSTMVPQWDSAIQAMADKFVGEGGFIPVCSGAFDQLDQATEDYTLGLEELQKQAGTSFEDLAKGLDKNIEKTEKLLQDNTQLISKYGEEVEAIKGVITKLQELEQEYKDVYDAANKAMETGYKTLHDEKDNDANVDSTLTEPEKEDTPQIVEEPAPAPVVEEPAKPSLTVGSFVDVKSGVKWYANSYGGGASGRAKDGKIKYINSKGTHPYNIGGAGWIKKSDIVGYDTGGYTGDWSSNNGRLAMLHQKELVLNASDTKNMLNAIEIVRDITSNLGAALMSRMAGISATNTDGGNSGVLEQNVHITAEFPNVENSHEIEDALNNLINKASQYIQK